MFSDIKKMGKNELMVALLQGPWKIQINSMSPQKYHSKRDSRAQYFLTSLFLHIVILLKLDRRFYCMGALHIEDT